MCNLIHRNVADNDSSSDNNWLADYILFTNLLQGRVGKEIDCMVIVNKSKHFTEYYIFTRLLGWIKNLYDLKMAYR